MSRHKIAQHEGIYGTWDAKTNEGPSNAKKSRYQRVSNEDNSSSESDNEQGALVTSNEDKHIREDCDDDTDVAQLSIVRNNSATPEVMYSLPFFGPFRVRIVRV